MNKIIINAVIISFNPDLDVLRRELDLVAPQVDKIWLIDNASSNSLVTWVNKVGLRDKLELIQLSANLGLGAAQNLGMQRARDAGATAVLILDQDSEPMPDMVQNLIQAYDELRSADVLVAAVAPIYADPVSGQVAPFVRLSWFGYRYEFAREELSTEEVDLLIASGSLIPVNMINAIGWMDESLFIDHVDTEWCLRAKSKGYKVFAVPAARMTHSLGHDRRRIWFFGWRYVSSHSPFRYYYMLRNGLLLQKRAYISMKWRVCELKRALMLIAFYGFIGPGAWSRFRMMAEGLIDGLRGVSGAKKF